MPSNRAIVFQSLVWSPGGKGSATTVEPSKKGAVHHDPTLTFDTFTSL